MSAAESRRVPKDQIDGVVKALYAAADRLDWEHLPASNRTAQYDDWVTDPEIGGVLTKYMSSENARSWIKDGPMKEYGRARLGAGRYARFGTSVGPTAEQLVQHALGSDAAVVDNSKGVKPFHCLAKMDGATTYVRVGCGEEPPPPGVGDDQPPREQPEPRGMHRDLGDVGSPGHARREGAPQADR